MPYCNRYLLNKLKFVHFHDKYIKVLNFNFRHYVGTVYESTRFFSTKAYLSPFYCFSIVAWWKERLALQNYCNFLNRLWKLCFLLTSWFVSLGSDWRREKGEAKQIFFLLSNGKENSWQYGISILKSIIFFHRISNEIVIYICKANFFVPSKVLYLFDSMQNQ